MWNSYNPNPNGAIVGDCTVRALSKALGKKWDQVYSELAVQGFALCNMPSANHVWGAYLKKNGFKRYIVSDECPDCYTVRDFCKDNPQDIFVLALSGHVVAVKDGNYYDTWDSGNEVPLYHWKKG